MEYTEKDLIVEIESVIEGQECAFEQSWLATAIMQRHTGIEGPDKEFFILCGWGFVKSTIRSVMRKLKPDPSQETDAQLVLPGYKHLQKRYCIERHNQPWVVPVNELTNHELALKEKEYMAMAAGCMEHAEELRRYRLERQKQTLA